MQTNNLKEREQDMLNYWKTLFPDTITEERFFQIIGHTTHISIQDIEGFIKSQDDNPMFSVLDVLNKEISNHLMQIWDNVIEKSPMSQLFLPLINYQYETFYKKAEANPHIDNIQTLMEQFLHDLCENLLELAHKTLILDINICRLEDFLKGATSEERYQYYISEILTDKRMLHRFYTEYLHLYSTCMTIINNFYQSIDEILEYTGHQMENLFNRGLIRNKKLMITKIETGKGDRHNNGRTVSILHFSDQSKLVYKPRSLKLEKGFYNFLAWINQGLLTARQLFLLKLLDCGEYGFVEYIEYQECQDEEDIKNYYFRIGALMAALYTLNAKDIHNENIIAHGSQPVVIDLEALFHSIVSLQNTVEERERAVPKAFQVLDSSVYSIGLLPMQISNSRKETAEAVDISGLGGEEEQTSPFKTYMIVNKKCDTIKLETVNYMLKPCNNIPMLNGKKKTAQDYTAYLLEGFQYVYHTISQHKDDVKMLIKKNFDACRCRIILRPTYLYSQLTGTSFHPDFMHSRVHRFVLLNRLGCHLKEPGCDIVSSEIEDILNGDVPYFTSDINDTQIQDTRGRELKLTLPYSPLEYVMKKIDRLSKKDFQLQQHIIYGAFISKTLKEYREFWETKNTFIASSLSADYLKTACDIGDLIAQKATMGQYKDKQEKSYISFIPVGIDHISYQYAVVEGDLYNGNAGIALFFAWLYEITGKQKYLNESLETIRPVLDGIRNIDPESAYLAGPYNGISGYLYTISKLYQITKDDDFSSVLINGLSKLNQLIESDRCYDIISGCSGVIQVMCSILKQSTHLEIINKSKDIIRKSVQHLLKSSITIDDNKLCWESQMKGIRYTGYAHGTSGIAASLYQAHKIICVPQIDEVIEKVLNFEDSLYCPERENWKSSQKAENCSVGWCHGAPGILLGRIQLAEMGYQSHVIERDIITCIRTTEQHGFGNNICYCHGDIGNLEILERAGNWLQDKKLLDSCNLSFHRAAKGFLTYIKSNQMLPVGLMLGGAGIGYSLLRRVSLNVPSILNLE